MPKPSLQRKVSLSTNNSCGEAKSLVQADFLKGFGEPVRPDFADHVSPGRDGQLPLGADHDPGSSPAGRQSPPKLPP
jgi:hypothetical protein